MDETPPAPLELSPLARLGAFLLFTAGIAAVFAGGQVWMRVLFYVRWHGYLPVLQMFAGVMAVLLSVHLNHPRRWALLLAFPVLGGLACAGVPYAIWLMYNGIYTALSVFAPGWASLAFLVILASVGEFLRVSRARRVADAETAKLTAEALAAGYGYARSEARGSAWFLPVAFTVAAIPTGCLVMAVGWPDTWVLVSTRFSGLLAGRNPLGEVWVDNADDYPFSGSPVAWYLETEARFLPVADAQVLGFMDRVADDVAWALA
jgi:hypothetical protein